MKQKIFTVLALTSMLSSNTALWAKFPSNNAKTTAAATASSAVAALPQPIDLTYAAERAINSVVYIKVLSSKTPQTYRSPFDDFFGDFFGQQRPQPRQEQAPRLTASGSGVILSADGYIVTNNHVVKNADELTIVLNDNREFKARIIGLDENTDLALLKIEATDLSYITVGSSEKLRIGEWVLAIGNPFGLTSTVTAGIVSAKSRSQGANPVESFIQTDAAINKGNSGGALVNAQGELVGINAMIYSQTGSYAGYGFAIPTTIMNKVVEDLKNFGTVQRALIGIVGTDLLNHVEAEKAKGKDVDYGISAGIYVSEVSADGAAEAAKIQKGDIITAIDNKKITKFGELQEVIAAHRPGDEIRVTYYRNKKEHTATLTLRNVQGTTGKIEAIDTEQMGASLRALTDKEKQELNLRNGIVVSNIRQGKLMEAGLSKGIIIMQVNDKTMNTPADFDEAVKAANMSNDRVLWIRAKTQSGVNCSYTVELGDTNNSKKTKNKK